MGYKKLIQSGSLVETYEYQYNNIAVMRGGQRKRERNCKRSKERNRRPDNVFRIQRHFKRIVRSNLVRGECPLLVTLTMYETVSVRRAYRSFSRFIQRLRNQYGKVFKYVAVPEFQGDISISGEVKPEGGAVHFHVLFWGLNITPNEEKSKRHLQWAWRRGYVDCIQTNGSVQLAGYLTKYLFKAVSNERLGNEKAYVCSRNILRPVQTSFSTVFDYLNEIVGDTPPEKVVQFESLWLGWCKYSRYVLWSSPLSSIDSTTDTLPALQ